MTNSVCVNNYSISNLSILGLLVFLFSVYVITSFNMGESICESARIDLRQSDAYSMYYVGISGVRMNVSNEMHCICTRTRAQIHVDIWYSIIDMCGMIKFVRDVIWICKDRFNTQIPIVLLKHHISNFGASRFLHSPKQCLLFIKAWTHTTQKWYQMIWNKTLFHKMYNNLLLIDDF